MTHHHPKKTFCSTDFTSTGQLYYYVCLIHYIIMVDSELTELTILLYSFFKDHYNSQPINPFSRALYVHRDMIKQYRHSLNPY
jgi:hypothetical protein